MSQQSADVHHKMSKTHRDSTESPSDYFYKMLALSKKGELPDSAICTHIVNGINDYDLKRKVSNSYISCNELLRDILAYSAHNIITHNASQMSNKRDLNVNLHKPNSSLVTKRAFNDKVEVSVKCYNCQKVGHYSSKCPEPQRKPRCTHCNRTTHDSASCPDNTKTGPKINKIDSGSDSEISKSISANGNETVAFVDQGSTRTLIRKSFAENVGVLQRCAVTLHGFGGGKFLCTQKLFVKIVIDNSDYLITENVLLAKDILCRGGNKLIILGNECYVENIRKIQTSQERSSVENELINGLILENDSCFAEKANELGKCSLTKMKITLTSNVPCYTKPYRTHFALRLVVGNIISELLDSDIIRPSDSPYASGIVVVKKQNGEHRLCVDYRRLNSITVKIPFPMPNLEEQFAQLAGNAYFSQLALRMGYHQVDVCESSKQFTAFVTSDGHYEYYRMPFGLVNAPAVFQAVMNKVVKRMEPGEILAYLDDVIVLSKTFDEGIQRLEKFF